ncbi:MAG: hypothetical protein ACRCXZ_03225 [Patescibacteria group bacterium]
MNKNKVCIPVIAIDKMIRKYEDKTVSRPTLYKYCLAKKYINIVEKHERNLAKELNAYLQSAKASSRANRSRNSNTKP